MNDKQLEKKLEQDAAKVKKDISTLISHSAARFSRLDNNIGQAAGKAKEDLISWMEDGVSQLRGGFDKLTGDARETAVDTAATVKKEVGQGLRQYNAKAQEVANKVPGNFSKMVAKYSWVAITIGLAVGLLVGTLLKPARQSQG